MPRCGNPLKVFRSIGLAIVLAGSLSSCKETMKCGDTEIRRRVDQIKVEKDVTVRTMLAQKLFLFVESKNPHSLQECDIDKLIAMMADKDDGVRMWIADALGFVGPRAHAAVPALESAYQKIRCSKLEVTSAPEIYRALKRLGAKPAGYICP